MRGKIFEVAKTTKTVYTETSKNSILALVGTVY